MSVRRKNFFGDSLDFDGCATWRGGIYRMGIRDKEVTFQEPMIEEAVRVMLDRPNGIIIYKDLKEMTEIYIQAEEVYATMDDFYNEGGKWYESDSRVHGPITDLPDLKIMPNLRIVLIGAEQIRDLLPLADLEYLERISFRNNHIEDLSPLAGNKQLADVDLLENPLKGIEEITGWPALRSLNIGGTGSYDGSPVGTLKGMDVLDICNDSDAYQYLDGLRVGELVIGATGQTDADCIRDVAYVQNL